MPKVLVTATGHRGDSDPRFNPLREAGWEVTTHRWPGGRPDEEEVIELVHGYDAVIASSNERYTRTVLERADTVKHVARWGVGYETVDVPAAYGARPIPLRRERPPGLVRPGSRGILEMIEQRRLLDLAQARSAHLG